MQKLLIAEKSVQKGMRDLLKKEWAIHAVNSNCPEMLQPYLINTENAAQILLKMGVCPKLTGYRCLICAISMVADDPSLLLKEIYPDVAKMCGLSDYRCVEHTIRTAIRKAWKNRDEYLWIQYFPRDKTGEVIRPTNKEFISRIAEEL